MGDVVAKPEPEEQDAEFADKLVDLRDRLDDAARVALVGDRAANIRRPVLFVVIGLALALNLPPVGIVALLALAYTDQVVPL